MYWSVIDSPPYASSVLASFLLFSSIERTEIKWLSDCVVLEPGGAHSSQFDLGVDQSAALSQIGMAHSLILGVEIVKYFVVFVQLFVSYWLFSQYTLCAPLLLQIAPHYEKVNVLDYFLLLEISLLKCLLDIRHLLLAVNWISLELFFLFENCSALVWVKFSKPLVDSICNLIDPVTESAFIWSFSGQFNACFHAESWLSSKKSCIWWLLNVAVRGVEIIFGCDTVRDCCVASKGTVCIRRNIGLLGHELFMWFARRLWISLLSLSINEARFFAWRCIVVCHNVWIWSTHAI